MKNKRSVKWIIGSTSGTKNRMAVSSYVPFLLEFLMDYDPWKEIFAWEILPLSGYHSIDGDTLVHVWFASNIKPTSTGVWLYTVGGRSSIYKSRNVYYTSYGELSERRLQVMGIPPWKIFNIPMAMPGNVTEKQIRDTVERLINVYSYLFNLLELNAL